MMMTMTRIIMISIFFFITTNNDVMMMLHYYSAITITNSNCCCYHYCCCHYYHCYLSYYYYYCHYCHYSYSLLVLLLPRVSLRSFTIDVIVLRCHSGTRKKSSFRCVGIATTRAAGSGGSCKFSREHPLMPCRWMLQRSLTTTSARGYVLRNASISAG